MSSSATALLSSTFFAADDQIVSDGIHFNSLPANYVAWFLIPLGLILFAWFFYKRENRAPTWAKVSLTLLRAAAIFLVILLLFDPYRQFRKVEEIRSLVTVVVDGSASMARRDAYEQDQDLADELRRATKLGSGTSLNKVTRTELVQRALGTEGARLLERLAEKHDVRTFVYSAGKPRAIASLGELTNDGPVTATGDALAHLLADPEVQAKPDASIILIGDGRTNTGSSPIDIARYAGDNDKIPIHAIGVGDPDALRDIELRFIRADEVTLKGNTVKMEITVRNRGFDAGFVTISIKDQDRRSWVPTQTKKLLATENDQVFELDILANRVGTFTLTVAVQGPAGEENKDNNSREHTLTVKDDKIKILYVDTLPRWEYRRLKNFLVRGDQSFVTNCLLLSAEPSFRQETSAGAKPLREFPQTFEELDKFDVLIFGDVNPILLVPTPSKLTRILKNIQRFVDNGGGLAVICGDGWTPAAYADTPLEEVLPVDISFSGDAGLMSNYVDEWKPKLSAAGRRHPITQLKPDANANTSLWEDARRFPLKSLRWWYPVRKASPGGQVLAYHPDGRNRFGSYPLLVTGNYGDGPVFFSAIDETWRWFFQTGPVYFNRYWGNVVRYLARAHLYRGSKRYKLLSDRSEYQQGQTIKLKAFVKNKNFDPALTETQRVMVSAPDSKTKLVEFKKQRDGEYAYSFKPSKFGRYQAWIVGDEGVAGKRYAPISFEAKFVDPERQNPAMNEAALKEIADASGGSYLRLAQAEDIFERLRADTTRRSKTSPRPIKSRAWLPMVLLALLATEWLLRRRLNMV